jgi:hypothetical protein
MLNVRLAVMSTVDTWSVPPLRLIADADGTREGVGVGELKRPVTRLVQSGSAGDGGLERAGAADRVAAGPEREDRADQVEVVAGRVDLRRVGERELPAGDAGELRVVVVQLRERDVARAEQDGRAAAAHAEPRDRVGPVGDLGVGAPVGRVLPAQARAVVGPDGIHVRVGAATGHGGAGEAEATVAAVQQVRRLPDGVVLEGRRERVLFAIGQRQPGHRRNCSGRQLPDLTLAHVLLLRLDRARTRLARLGEVA